jgi:DNA-binding XRE family transcriptional regulator
MAMRYACLDIPVFVLYACHSEPCGWQGKTERPFFGSAPLAKKKATTGWSPAIEHVLRAARVERGLTQRQLSVMLGKASNVMNLIETGNRSCSLNEFLQICELIEADPREILGRIVRW